MISGRYSWLIGVVIAAAALCIPMSAPHAATGVDNLILSPNGEFTELTVVGGGSTLCNHFTEPAKNGAPFRIVLDFCDASHELGQMQFANLPKTRISRIRTSQFATSPQKIVRVVLDMVDEATYSVVRDGSSLTVRVVDPNRATFAEWKAHTPAKQSSTVMATVAPKTTAPVAAPPASSKPAPVVAKKQDVKTESKPPAMVQQAPAKKSSPVVAQKPALQPVKEPVLATPTPASDAEPTVAIERSRTEAFIPPKTPLVFAPSVLENPTQPMTVAQAPAKKNDIVVSKETMHPMGPMPGNPSMSGTTASNNVSDAQWASTTAPDTEVKSAPKTSTPVFASDDPPQFAVTTPNDMAAVNDETPLIERLKEKFFGEQNAPRPYTTVGDGQPSNDVQGPPSPNSKISREELLARIREAQRRAASGEFRRSESGAGGVPTRQILFYDDMGRRDPFNPLVTGQRSGFVTDELPNVETLRLVGILHDDHEALALLENLEGYGYILRVGDPVKNGSLIAIQNTRALFRVDDYGWTHTVALQLTSRGTDPTKSLGAVPQEFPTFGGSGDGNNSNGNSTSNQGSDEE